MRDGLRGAAAMVRGVTVATAGVVGAVCAAVVCGYAMALVGAEACGPVAVRAWLAAS